MEGKKSLEENDKKKNVAREEISNLLFERNVLNDELSVIIYSLFKSIMRRRSFYTKLSSQVVMLCVLREIMKTYGIETRLNSGYVVTNDSERENRGEFQCINYYWISSSTKSFDLMMDSMFSMTSQDATITIHRDRPNYDNFFQDPLDIEKEAKNRLLFDYIYEYDLTGWNLLKSIPDMAYYVILRSRITEIFHQHFFLED